MGLEAQLRTVRRRNAAVRQVEEVIEDLPLQMRREVLLEALINVDAAAKPVKQPLAVAADDDVATVDEATFVDIPLVEETAAQSKPNTELLVEALAASPGAQNDDLADAVFGDHSKRSKEKIRSMLTSLKKQGRVEKPKARYWVVVAKHKRRRKQTA